MGTERSYLSLLMTDGSGGVTGVGPAVQRIPERETYVVASINTNKAGGRPYTMGRGPRMAWDIAACCPEVEPEVAAMLKGRDNCRRMVSCDYF